jgi:hypothetical protein
VNTLDREARKGDVVAIVNWGVGVIACGRVSRVCQSEIRAAGMRVVIEHADRVDPTRAHADHPLSSAWVIAPLDRERGRGVPKDALDRPAIVGDLVAIVYSGEVIGRGTVVDVHASIAGLGQWGVDVELEGGSRGGYLLQNAWVMPASAKPRTDARRTATTPSSRSPLSRAPRCPCGRVRNAAAPLRLYRTRVTTFLKVHATRDDKTTLCHERVRSSWRQISTKEASGERDACRKCSQQLVRDLLTTMPGAPEKQIVAAARDAGFFPLAAALVYDVVAAQMQHQATRVARAKLLSTGSSARSAVCPECHVSVPTTKKGDLFRHRRGGGGTVGIPASEVCEGSYMSEAWVKHLPPEDAAFTSSKDTKRSIQNAAAKVRALVRATHYSAHTTKKIEDRRPICGFRRGNSKLRFSAKWDNVTCLPCLGLDRKSVV